MTSKVFTTTLVALLLATTSFTGASLVLAGRSLAATSSQTYAATSADHLGSNITGQHVYSSTAADAQDIGAIKDLVVDKTGTVRAIVVGVGGFLGIGQKNVAVDYGQVQWITAADGSLRAVVNTTKEALQAAADFNFTDSLIQPNNGALANKQPGSAAAPASQTGDASGAPGMDMSTLRPVEATSLKSDDLKGIDVIDPSGRKLAEINDFVLSSDGKVDAVLVDFGGFLGIGKKQVAIAFEGLTFLADGNNKRYLEVNVTKDQLDAPRGYDKDDYTANRLVERMIVSKNPGSVAKTGDAGPDPAQFSAKASASNAFEIVTSQLALVKSQNADIKNFAQKMIDDHTKAAGDLKVAAAAQNAPLANGPDGVQQAEVNKLNALDGSAFDKLYVSDQIKAHADAVGLFQTFAGSAGSGPLKDFAAKTLPILQMHNDMVQKLPK